MRQFKIEIFIDDKPSEPKWIKASNITAAIGKAVREEIKRYSMRRIQKVSLRAYK